MQQALDWLIARLTDAGQWLMQDGLALHLRYVCSALAQSFAALTALTGVFAVFRLDGSRRSRENIQERAPDAFLAIYRSCRHLPTDSPPVDEALLQLERVRYIKGRMGHLAACVEAFVEHGAYVKDEKNAIRGRLKALQFTIDDFYRLVEQETKLKLTLAWVMGLDATVTGMSLVMLFLLFCNASASVLTLAVAALVVLGCIALYKTVKCCLVMLDLPPSRPGN